MISHWIPTLLSARTQVSILLCVVVIELELFGTSQNWAALRLLLRLLSACTRIGEEVRKSADVLVMTKRSWAEPTVEEKDWARLVSLML